MDSNITLREITKENLIPILKLKVSPVQEKFVASNGVSLAQAHFEPRLPWFHGIYAGDEPVGFSMVEYDDEEEIYFLWRFMIDARFQGKGYGRRAMELILDFVKSQPNSDALFTSCVPEEGGPGPFYEKLGFAYTGEEDEGELGMKRLL